MNLVVVATITKRTSKWDGINCRTDCGRCNATGLPSVMKGSKTCEIRRKEIKPEPGGISFLKQIRTLFNNKGKMRAFGKVKEKEINE